MTGGVHTGAEVIKAMMAGARVAMTTSALLRHGFEHLSAMRAGATEWMEAHEYESIMVREHTEKVKPPRALFVPFPFGHALGRPNDAALQHRVLRAALDLLAEPRGPVLRDFPDDAEPGAEPPAPVQASVIAPAPDVPADPIAELAGMRRQHAQWLERSGGRTALGLSGVPAARLDAVAHFLRGLPAATAPTPPASGRPTCRCPASSATARTTSRPSTGKATWR